MLLSAIPFPAIDPILIQLGPLAIRWYSLAYIAGFLLGWMYIKRLLLSENLWKPKAPMTVEQSDDFLLWTAVGVILGGRIGYSLFYNFAYYAANPLDILKVWEGGMSFHGGLLGVTIAIFIYCRRNKLSYLSVMDLVAAAVPIGLFFGRIANFINGELFGRVTDVPWAVIFPRGGPDPRHASQIYEALLEGMLMFLVLGFLIRKFKILHHPGMASGVFLTGYGLSRIFVEFFRMPDVQLGYFFGFITMGMILSVPMVLFGLGVVWYTKKS